MKYFSVLLAMALVFSLAACSGEDAGSRQPGYSAAQSPAPSELPASTEAADGAESSSQPGASAEEGKAL